MIATATRLNYKGSKAPFTLRPVLGDTSNTQQKTQHKHKSISTDPTPPHGVNDLSLQTSQKKRRRLENGGHQQPFPVLPIQLPEHLRPRYSLPSASSSSSSIETRSRTRLYDKGVPPLQVFDYNDNSNHHHRPKEPFACAKNQMGWINAPSVVEYEHDIYQHLREIEVRW